MPFFFFSLYFLVLLPSCPSINVYVSQGSTPGDGSIATPFNTIELAFAFNANESDLSLFLLNNPPNITYTLNSLINLSLNFNLSCYGGDVDGFAIIDFSDNGGFSFSGANSNSIRFDHIIFQQTLSSVRVTPVLASSILKEINFESCLFTNLNPQKNPLLAFSGTKNLSFNNCNFILLILGDFLISVSNSELIKISNCVVADIFIKDSSLFFVSSSFLQITNSQFINNTLQQENKIFTPSLFQISCSLELSQSVFKLNSMLNSSIFLITNDGTQNLIINITAYVNFDGNSEIFEAPLAFNINGPNISVLISEYVIFNNNYASQSLISVSKTFFGTFEADKLEIVDNFGFELVKLELMTSISFKNFNCSSNNNNENPLNNDLPGNCLSIINYRDVSMYNCTFSNNFAISTLTGVLFEHNSQLSLLNLDPNANLTIIMEFIKCSENIVNATQNILRNSGNCFFLLNSGYITITNSEISHNIINVEQTAESSGNPCLDSQSNYNNLIIINTTFEDNHAYTECSCLNFHGAEITIHNSSFLENRGIQIASSFSIASEGGCLNLGAANVGLFNILIFNASALRGGGIFFHNKNSKSYQLLWAQNLTILQSEGTQTSGMELDATLNLGDYYFVNCTFNANRVNFYGVISTFYYTNFNLYFWNNTFSFNWGISAGAAFSFCHFGGNVFFNNTLFERNVLNQSVFVGGAAFFVYGFTSETLIYVKNCSFIENFSNLKGGAIQSTYGQVYVQDSIFIDNYALIGGAISMSVFCYGGLENVVIQNRFQVNQGGGVHFSDFALMNITNTSFFDCQARQGGAIYVDGSQMNFFYFNVTFVNASADDGAAIWILNTLAPKTVLQNILIIQSTSSRSGLLYFSSTSILLVDMKIENSEGRVIYLSNSELSLSNIYISSHKCRGLNSQGCFLIGQTNSVVAAINIWFSDVESSFDEDAFSLTECSVLISNISFFNYSTPSDSVVVTGYNSVVVLQDSNFENMQHELIHLQGSELRITNCSFKNISSPTPYGIIYFQNGQIFVLSDSLFYGITGGIGGCLTILGSSGLEYTSNFTNVTAESGKAENGAFAYILDRSISISNSVFSKNIASGSGGCFYFDCQQQNNFNWTVSSSSFINNVATQGGAYHSVRYIPKYDYSTVFVNNSAIYGNIFSAFPLRLTLEIGEQKVFCGTSPANCYIRMNDTSGQTITPIIVDVIDYYNQKMILLDGLAFLNIYSQDISENSLNFNEFPENSDPYRSNALLKGVETQKLINGSFNFSEVIVSSEPPSNIWLTVNTNLIPEYLSEFFSDSFFDRVDPKTNQYLFIFKLNLRDCIPGEIYSNNNSECSACPKGKYSFQTTDKYCKNCPLEASCAGRTNMVLNPGYWRGSITSDDIYTCNILTESCLGGLNSSCLNGYDGPLCAACEYDSEKKFFKKGLFYCEECANVWIYIIFVLIAVALLIALIVFLIHSKRGASVESYVLVKIIMNHIQTISFISNIKINFPKIIQLSSGVQAPITSVDSLVFTIECFQDQIGMSNFETKLILSTILPFATSLFMIMVYFFSGYYKKKSKKTILHNLANGFIIVLTFFQPSFINFYIQNLSCDKIGNTSYLTYNMEQECWDKAHTAFSAIITIPFLLLWMAVFPLVFLIYMLIHRKNLQDPHIRNFTQYFQAGYQERCFFWEFVEMSRKFLVILLTTFLRNNPNAVVYILVPVISSYVVLQVIMMPFQNTKFHNFNALELLSLTACFITYYAAVFYNRVFTENKRNFLLFLMLFFNSVFLIRWVQNYMLYMKKKITKMMSSLKSSSNTKKILKSPGLHQMSMKIKEKKSSFK